MSNIVGIEGLNESDILSFSNSDYKISIDVSAYSGTHPIKAGQMVLHPDGVTPIPALTDEDSNGLVKVAVFNCGVDLGACDLETITGTGITAADLEADALKAAGLTYGIMFFDAPVSKTATLETN